MPCARAGADPRMQKLACLLLLVVAALCFGSLASGAGIVEHDLPGGLPVGNALAALGLCALAGAACVLAPPGSTRRRVAAAVLLAALLWLPVSIALAGNLALNFSGARGTLWFAMTVGLGLAVPAMLAWAIVGSLLDRRARSRTA